MKKTCMNCKYYYSTLSDGESFFHIHDWCDQWKTQLKAYAHADMVEHDYPYNSDLETGEAYCYMFEPADKPAYPDEWYDANRAENERRVKGD